MVCQVLNFPGRTYLGEYPKGLVQGPNREALRLPFCTVGSSEVGVMGGEPPKRDEQRRRRNKRQIPVEKIPGGAPAPPELALVDPHPLAVSLFEALKCSPESAYLTPAGWERARVSAHVLSMQLRSDRVSPTTYKAIQSDWKALLIDAGELRRLGIEVQRPAQVDPGEESAVAALDDYRGRR